jgi:hypothetical protein
MPFVPAATTASRRDRFDLFVVPGDFLSSDDETMVSPDDRQ